MDKGCIVFFVLNEYDDLGTGYISAVLVSAGYKTRTFDIREDRDMLLKKTAREKPLAVGFSVIYQYHITEFAVLARFLRDRGLGCHFTAGGHYATTRPGELLELIPELDSVIRGEGEYPMLGLAEALFLNRDWHKTENLVYRDQSLIIMNRTRPLIEDLDVLPLPLRAEPRDYAFGRTFATLLAGRGCIHNCSFCSLREFYADFAGHPRRIRNPRCVAGEIEYLHRQKGCSVFLFQDDCFPLKESIAPGWALEFCNELEEKGLAGKILWKINCRPDEIDEELFTRMKSCGLYLVFIGIEDGTDSGLDRINKNFKSHECIRGIDILRKLKIGFDYGFMLFQPWTTFTSLKENLGYLETICSDGYAPVTFLKMMPYYATKIEQDLIDSGRIRGGHGFRDYDFSDKRLTHYYEYVSLLFSNWNYANDGLVNVTKWARNYLSVCSFYSPGNVAADLMSYELRVITAGANRFITYTMEELSALYENDVPPDTKMQERYSRHVKSFHNRTRMRISSLMYSLVTVTGRRKRTLSKLADA